MKNKPVGRRKILFVSDYGPSEKFAGGLVMRNQINYLQNYFDLDYLIISPHPFDYEIEIDERSKLLSISKPGERMPNLKSKILREVLGFFYENIIVSTFLLYVDKTIKSSNLDSDYDFIFVTLEGSFVPQAIKKSFLEKSDLVIQYWDAESWWSEVHNFSRYSSRKMMEAYLAIESSSNVRHLIVPSGKMRGNIEMRSPSLKNYISVLYPPPAVSDCKTQDKNSHDAITESYDLRIMFAGSTYAHLEINMLIRALQSVSWNIEGKKVALFIFGNVEDGALTKSNNVFCFGRVKPEAINLAAKNANVLFLPYPTKLDSYTNESFPSKLSTYVQFSKNILVIASPNSALVEYAEANGIDQFLVKEASIDCILEVLRKLVSSKQLREEQLNAIEILKDGDLSRHMFENRLDEIFEIRDFEYSKVRTREAYIQVKKNWLTRLNLIGRKTYRTLRSARSSMFDRD